MDVLDETGLTVKTLAEIKSDLITGMQGIYGSDINVDSNSPDGQAIGIFAQAAADLRELLVSINAMFDPDQAIGSILDQRVVFNSIERAGGTFTVQPIDIILNSTVTLMGLDGSYNDVNGTGFTVADDAGNQFILIDTVTLAPGAYTINFRAQQLGQVQTTAGTITNPITIVAGVASVNNSLAALAVGQDEETDVQLRIRRQRSVAIASSGYLNGLLAKILELTGVTDAVLYENVTDTTDANGIPAHGIWLIVENGASTDIGNVIYSSISYGANMKGTVTVPITTASGAVFNALFSRPVAAALYIRFNIKKLNSTATFDAGVLATYIVNNLDYNIGQAAETSSITIVSTQGLAAQGKAGQGVILDVAISSDGVTYTDYLVAPTLDGQWTPSTAHIAATVVA